MSTSIPLSSCVPSRLQIDITSRHTFESTVYTARHSLDFEFDVDSSDLSGLHNWGVLPKNITSNTYTAAEAGNFTLDLDTALPGSGVVEYRINGGSYQTGIAASGTTGTITGVAVSDTIEVRHITTTSDVEQMLRLSAPIAGFVAYAILTN